MSSPCQRQPEAVADKVLKRAEVGKMARRLQSHLALAQFKASRGWQDLSLDLIEPKYEEELRQHKSAVRRNRLTDGEILSDSSSSASDPYPRAMLMSSPWKAPLFSDAVGSSNGSSGHRKRNYMSTFDSDVHLTSSPTKRYRLSPTARKSFPNHGFWDDNYRYKLSSDFPIKPRRQPHFKGRPDDSSSNRLARSFSSPTFAVLDDDDDDDPLVHSFAVNVTRSSPPTTPPMCTRRFGHSNKNMNMNTGENAESRDEGAHLLLFMKTSPTHAVVPPRGQMEPPSTPPPKHLGFTPQAMATPNLDNPLFPHTPGQAFNFADYLNMTPSPAQNTWKTPNLLGSAKTPRSVARRHLALDQAL